MDIAAEAKLPSNYSSQSIAPFDHGTSRAGNKLDPNHHGVYQEF
jgi:hypothetical protein